MESKFMIKENQDGTLAALEHSRDSDKMNWVAGETPWGTVKRPAGLTVTVQRRILPSGNLEECYTFANETAFPLFMGKTDIGIYTPFNDDYLDSPRCLTQRCNTHIFCGGESSYVMALRMGGAAPHLGLILTAGSLSCYSVERNLKERSNDRGDFILHPRLKELQPGESAVVAWELFWFNSRHDFQRQLLWHHDFLQLETRQCSWYAGENMTFEVLTRQKLEQEQVGITLRREQDIPLPFTLIEGSSGTKIFCEYPTGAPGEYLFIIKAGKKSLHTRHFVSLPREELISRRCRFIAEKQQYHNPGSSLDGAYIIYDREDDRQYYRHTHDHNGGRERLGMGALMALWLNYQRAMGREDQTLKESLLNYRDYVYRELYDRESGTVFNDINRNLEWHRLYNYPWMTSFQLELYYLLEDQSYLRDAYQTMMRYYQSGGEKFYAIGIPAAELYRELMQAGLTAEAGSFKEKFLAHAGQIRDNGLNYPVSEVNYEQSIVAPAAGILLQAYELGGDVQYLHEGKRQLDVLSLFNGRQPDYRQFENSIRHWDGYWFGKRAMFGDTYPHYWSVLTGVEYQRYARLTGKHEYRELAEASIRGCLNLYTPEGFGSCAMVFPETVNGQPGNFYDPWANDQDWALYYNLKIT